VYDRTTNTFANATFFKPAEKNPDELSFKLAPLVIQEVVNGIKSPSRVFGALTPEAGKVTADASLPTIYTLMDAVELSGASRIRLSYVWFYPSIAMLGSLPGDQKTNTGPQIGFLQGVRITLNSAGLPVIWEMLAPVEGLQAIYVAQSIEAAVAAQYGKPLPARRFAVERALDETPETLVPRVLDDGPVAMGPIVYLSAISGEVTTIICRCMAAQVRNLAETRIYELQPFSSIPDSVASHIRRPAGARAAFWPGDAATDKRLEKMLRLPKDF
jgi:hypothetical protein